MLPNPTKNKIKRNEMEISSNAIYTNSSLKDLYSHKTQSCLKNRSITTKHNPERSIYDEIRFSYPQDTFQQDVRHSIPGHLKTNPFYPSENSADSKW